jgi:sec-independent protein translocase protein TatC
MRQTKPVPVYSNNKNNRDHPPEDDGNDLRMSLWEHLADLRNRLLRAMLAVIAGTVVGAVFAGQMLDYMRGPYCRAADIQDACQLVVLGPTGSIVAYFRVALMIGGVLAVPLVSYQIMMFILPGLTRKEKRVVLMSLPAISILFVIGASFAWFVLMPPALGFLEGFQPTLFKPEWTAPLYINFVTSLIFWMGVAFETPLVFFVLALLGMVSAGSLIHNWRVAIVGAAVAAAMITPTVDPVNMALVMAPLLTLYILSIFLVMIGRRISGVG